MVMRLLPPKIKQVMPMNKIIPRFGIALFVVGLLIVPVFGLSGGPSALNSDEELTVKYGCNCHNNGAASPRVVVMITGVPIMYELSETYNLTVTVADSLTLSGGDGNVKAGFLLSSDSVGVFSWSDDQDISKQKIALMTYPIQKLILMEYGILDGLLHLTMSARLIFG